MFLELACPERNLLMKPSPIDRLLTICLCFDLVLAFWCLSLKFAYHDTMLAVVF